MIKIIKEGTKKIATCYNCGCIFSYEREDIKDDMYDDNYMPPPQFIKEWVNCPQCNEEIVLKQGR